MVRNFSAGVGRERAALNTFLARFASSTYGAMDGERSRCEAVPRSCRWLDWPRFL